MPDNHFMVKNSWICIFCHKSAWLLKESGGGGVVNMNMEFTEMCPCGETNKLCIIESEIECLRKLDWAQGFLVLVPYEKSQNGNESLSLSEKGEIN